MTAINAGLKHSYSFYLFTVTGIKISAMPDILIPSHPLTVTNL